MKITVIVYGNIVEEIEQTILSVKNNSKWDETDTSNADSRNLIEVFNP